MILQRRRVQQRHLIDDASRIGEVRRESQRLARSWGLDETLAGRVAIAATELATNLHRHGGGGELLIQPVATGDGGEVIELVAIDRGRGMGDIERCLADGYSTGGTAGQGLGAVRRLAAEFDVYSIPGEGTVVMARIGAAPAARFGAISIPYKGETLCGDSWAIALDGPLTEVLVIDGLGHGGLAAAAADKAQELFVAGAAGRTPASFLDAAHRALSGTRGAAAAMARVTPDHLSYAGVGNVAARLLGAGASQGLVSHNGTLGLKLTRLQQFEYANAPGSCLVMHTDGVSARWQVDEALRARHPAVIAAVLYRDHARASDDATVVVVNA